MSQSKVFLVGAGPGDPELLTLKGKKALEQADAVVYDRLVGPAILRFVNPLAELIFVGKESSFHTSTQDEINRTLAELARGGKTVVRLKGGDPYIFGRGGEEAAYLAGRGIPFEVVPGVTAASGVGAYAGIPLTDRRYSPAVTFVTGHRMKGEGLESINWAALAELGHTIVFYMGVANLQAITKNLIDNAMTAATPVAVVSRGTMPGQRTIVGTLGDICRRAREADVKPPALLIIGEVVSLGSILNWFEKERAEGLKEETGPVTVQV